jgi:hypothetical protein
MSSKLTFTVFFLLTLKEEALVIAANKINRRHNRHVQNQAKKNLDLGLTPDELALDNDEETTNKDSTDVRSK